MATFTKPHYSATELLLRKRLLSTSIADALWFVNIVCLPLIAERNAHEICLTQECLQIVRHLLWKQTTIHSLRNNNPMFDGNLWPNSFDQPSTAAACSRTRLTNFQKIQNKISSPIRCVRLYAALDTLEHAWIRHVPTSLKDCPQYPTADGAPQPVLPSQRGHHGVHGQVAEPLWGLGCLRLIQYLSKMVCDWALKVGYSAIHVLVV